MRERERLRKARFDSIADYRAQFGMEKIRATILINLRSMRRGWTKGGEEGLEIVAFLTIDGHATVN